MDEAGFLREGWSWKARTALAVRLGTDSPTPPQSGDTPQKNFKQVIFGKSHWHCDHRNQKYYLERRSPF